MKQTKLILVGGFLGAGKTSVLYRAAEILKERGENVGLITNDQATNLVDTTFLTGNSMPVKEVSGSCFCCNFPALEEAVESVADEIDGGITIAEPVGSCTDLSATIMQPLKDKHGDIADTAPLTVLADPERIRGILDGKINTATYIATKQFDEADIILINKTDTLDKDDAEALAGRAGERWPKAKVMLASAKDNIGIEEWLDEVLGSDKAGQNLAEVDYDIYADGEAAYGWLNATYRFSRCERDYKKDAEKLLGSLEKELKDRGADIGHVKFLLRADGRQWLGNLIGMADQRTLREEASPEITEDTEDFILILNARAETGPKELQNAALSAIDEALDGYEIIGTEICTLIPGRPNPTYRYNKII